MGGYAQMITILHGGGVSRDPKKWLRNMCTTPMLQNFPTQELRYRYHLLVHDSVLRQIKEMALKATALYKLRNLPRRWWWVWKCAWGIIKPYGRFSGGAAIPLTWLLYRTAGTGREKHNGALYIYFTYISQCTSYPTIPGSHITL